MYSTPEEAFRSLVTERARGVTVPGSRESEQSVLEVLSINLPARELRVQSKQHAMTLLQSFGGKKMQRAHPPTAPDESLLNESAMQVEKVDMVMEQLKYISNEQKATLLGDLFVDVCRGQGVSVKKGFIELSLTSMKRLKEGGRRNIVYDLVRGVGTTSKDGSRPSFPVDRMPMGLLEYVTKFFAEESTSKVWQKLICI